MVTGAGSDMGQPGENHITANHFLKSRSEAVGLSMLGAGYTLSLAALLGP